MAAKTHKSLKDRIYAWDNVTSLPDLYCIVVKNRAFQSFLILLRSLRFLAAVLKAEFYGRERHKNERHA